ncbi:TPA: CDP-glycerol glycerophosphotransferase family protein [Vibrio harveyi]|nr:CDP-glycerol glycerophosphotransferase family protein [Vibrio harveyi]
MGLLSAVKDFKVHNMSLKTLFKTLKKQIKYQKKIIQDNQRVKRIKRKDKIKVGFFVLHHSVWKSDPVFKAMLEDDYFEPFIFICPVNNIEDNQAIEDIKTNVSFFEKKGYPVVSSYNENSSNWVDIDSLGIDLIFFSNPHKLTKKEYYAKAYSKYLSVYIPYAHQVSKYNNYKSQYNQDFHNMMWAIYAPHFDDMDIFKEYAIQKGKNVIVTGYPSMEPLLEDNQPNESPWKQQENTKRKVIFAPHHTIDTPELPYSTFIKFSDVIKELSEKHKDDIQWAFKPHPLLKEKLYHHTDWGKEKTDEYYDYWKNSQHCQLEEGDYYDLFKSSDAMIHDSGSFLAEYLYVKKPVLYLSLSEDIRNYQNAFGNKAYDCCTKGHSEKDINQFISEVIDGTAKVDNTFLENDILVHFADKTPTQKIISHIKEKLMDSPN